MKSTFDILTENNICFAVGVAVVTLKATSNKNQRDYFFIAHGDDKAKLRTLGLNFYKSPGVNSVVRSMLVPDVAEFKKLQDMFHKVQHDSDGRVYEIRGNSFKNYYKN